MPNTDETYNLIYNIHRCIGIYKTSNYNLIKNKIPLVWSVSQTSCYNSAGKILGKKSPNRHRNRAEFEESEISLNNRKIIVGRST